MIQLQSGKKIWFYSVGSPMPKICFEKFEDFNKIIDKPASLELQGRSPRGHPLGKMLKGCSLREVILVWSFGNLACITYSQGYK